MTLVLVDISRSNSSVGVPVWEQLPVNSVLPGLQVGPRGRQHELGSPQASTALIVLDNRNRDFDPTNWGDLVNVLRNPSFEVNLDHWSAQGGGAGVTVSRQLGGVFGQYRMQAVCDGSVGNQGIQCTNSAGALPLVVGQNYIVSAYVRVASGTASLRLDMTDNIVGVGANFTATTTWQRVILPVYAAQYTFGAVRVYATGTTAMTLHLDAVMVEPVPSSTSVARAYADGDTSGYRWQTFPAALTALITNPEFTLDTAGWSVGGAGTYPTFVRQTVGGNPVATAALLTGRDDTGYALTGFTAVANDVYRIHARVKRISGSGGSVYLTSAGTPSDVITLADHYDWQDIDFWWTAPTSAAWSLVVDVNVGIDAANLLSNGGFETNATGWTGDIGGTITRDSTHAKFGGWAGKIVGTYGGVSNTTVYPNSTWVTYGFWAYAETATTIAPSFFRADYVGQVGLATFQVPAGKWMYFQQTAYVPSTGDYHLSFQMPTAGTVWVDEVVVKAGAPSFWDDFERADTSPGTLGTSPTGHAWSMTAGGYLYARILSGRYVLPGTVDNVYAYVNLTTPPTKVSGRFSYAATAGATEPGMTISYCDTPSLGTLLHLRSGRTDWDLLVRQGGGDFYSILGGTYSTLANGIVYDVAMTVNGNTATVQAADGTRASVTDSRIGPIVAACPYVFWQIGSAETNNVVSGRWESVSAEQNLLIGERRLTVLVGEAQAFDTRNTSSVGPHLSPTYSGRYFDLLKPRRRMRVRASDPSYPIFDGYIDALPQESDGWAMQTVPVPLTDGFELLETMDLDTARASMTTNFTAPGTGILGGQCFISMASPGVVTVTSTVNFVANTKVRFQTTGGLPSPLVANTDYYVKTVLSGTTFTVSSTVGGTAITTTTAGSGLHAAYYYSAANTNNVSFVARPGVWGNNVSVEMAAVSGSQGDILINGSDIKVEWPPEANKRPASILIQYWYAGGAKDLADIVLAPGADGTGQLQEMAKTYLTGGEWDPQLSGARINAVLDKVSWPAELRNIDAGTITVDWASFGPEAEVSALSHIVDVTNAEWGLFFIDALGRAVFQDRAHRTGATSLGTFGTESGDLPLERIVTSYDKEYLYNIVRATRQSGVKQEVSDTNSKTLYGKRMLSLSPAYMSTDADALALANYLLPKYKDPMLRIRECVLNTLAGSALWTQALAREVSDKVTIHWRPLGGGPLVTQDSFIESVRHEKGEDLIWRTTWELSAA